MLHKEHFNKFKRPCKIHTECPANAFVYMTSWRCYDDLETLTYLYDSFAKSQSNNIQTSNMIAGVRTPFKTSSSLTHTLSLSTACWWFQHASCFLCVQVKRESRKLPDFYSLLNASLLVGLNEEGVMKDLACTQSKANTPAADALTISPRSHSLNFSHYLCKNG